MPEYVAKLGHYSNHLKRLVAMGENVELPEKEAGNNEHLYAPLLNRGGKPSLEDLMDRAVQANLGKESDLRKLPYAKLAELIKEGK